MDAAWLTRVLGPAVGPSARVVDVRVSRVGAGMGLLGLLRRYALTWEGGVGPASVVAKFPAPGPKSRSLARDMAMYPREVGFYRHLGGGSDLAVGCHHAAVDPTTHDFVLVLDDMSGATTIDQLAGCPPERTAELMAALADHHARHWDERGLERVPWLERLAGSDLADRIAAAVHACWPDVRARFGDELPRGVITVGDGLADALPLVAEVLSRPPLTLAHGDVRLDNVFFHDVRGVRLCDWQLTGRSRGARDLAYFLTQSLTPDDRRVTEEDLVRAYVARLDGRGVRGYDEGTAWDDVRAGTILGLAYAIVALGGLDQDDDRSTALPEAMLRRSAQAMSDYGCTLPRR